MTSAVDVVQTQVDAYNSRNAEAFSACYTEDAVILTAAGEVMMSGRDVILGAYRQMFDQSPDLHVEIPTRIVLGDWVVDEELGSGLVAEGFPTDLHAVVVYQIKDGLIARAQLYA